MTKFKITAVLIFSLMANFSFANRLILEVNWAPITFNGGVPVGGNVLLKIWDDGTYSFTGHFHDSGLPSYNVQALLTVTGHNGYVLTFSHEGHMAGTFEPGSRDNNWSIAGHNAYIATHWKDFEKASWHGNAHTGLDMGSLWNGLKSGLGAISGVVAVVGPLLAL